MKLVSTHHVGHGHGQRANSRDGESQNHDAAAAKAGAQPTRHQAAKGEHQVGNRVGLADEFGAEVEPEDVEVEEDGVDAAVDRKPEQGGVG